MDLWGPYKFTGYANKTPFLTIKKKTGMPTPAGLASYRVGSRQLKRQLKHRPPGGCWGWVGVGVDVWYMDVLLVLSNLVVNGTIIPLSRL